jgi:hypothetical protein
MRIFGVSIFLVISACAFGQVVDFGGAWEMNEEQRSAYIEEFSEWDSRTKEDWLLEGLESEDMSDDQTMDAIVILIEGEALDVDWRTRNGKVSLFDAAVRAGKFKTAISLVEHGYDVNRRCFECEMETAVHVLFKSRAYRDNMVGGLEVFQKLVEYGADLDLRDVPGDTPFHMVILNEDEDAFRYMLSDSVEFNVQNTTLKGKNYLLFFDAKWNDDALREVLRESTELRYPPTRREIADREREQRRQSRGRN